MLSICAAILGFVTILSLGFQIIPPCSYSFAARETLRSSARSQNATHVVITLATSGYERHALNLVYLLRTTGKYSGDIVVLTDEDNLRLVEDNINYVTLGHNVKAISAVAGLPPSYKEPPPVPCMLDDKRRNGWRGYYLKTAMFSNAVVGQWNTVLYMDSKTNILRPISETFFQNIDIEGTLMANPDAWPTFSEDWSMARQLSRGCNNTQQLYQELARTVNLSSTDYFQSTVVLFDTSILSPASAVELCQLYHKWGPLADGDQIILSLYWNNIKRLYKPLPYRVYGASASYTIPYDYDEKLPGAPYVLIAHRVP